jgi:hypothetical protein
MCRFVQTRSSGFELCPVGRRNGQVLIDGLRFWRIRTKNLQNFGVEYKLAECKATRFFIKISK